MLELELSEGGCFALPALALLLGRIAMHSCGLFLQMQSGLSVCVPVSVCLVTSVSRTKMVKQTEVPFGLWMKTHRGEA